ncbi:hypothetical protein BC826DRAFT_1047919 [Russula brevipes]|nr:hypothetical protein BC826DRAFT_1047919 [Russula brevipes]
MPPTQSGQQAGQRVTRSARSASAAAAASSSEKANTPTADQDHLAKDGNWTTQQKTPPHKPAPWSSHKDWNTGNPGPSIPYEKSPRSYVHSPLGEGWTKKAEEEERKEKEALALSLKIKLVRKAVRAENLKFYDTVVNEVYRTVSDSQIQIMDTAKSSKALVEKLTELNLSDRISPSKPPPPNIQFGSTIPSSRSNPPWDDAAFRPETFLASAKYDFSGRQPELNNKIVEGLKGPLTFQHQCQLLSWNQEVAKGVTLAHFQSAAEVIATLDRGLDRGYYPNHNETLLSTPEWAKLACATVAAVGRSYACSHAEEKTDFTYAARIGCEDVTPADFDLTFDSLFHRQLKLFKPTWRETIKSPAVVEDETREVLQMVARSHAEEALATWESLEVSRLANLLLPGLPQQAPDANSSPHPRAVAGPTQALVATSQTPPAPHDNPVPQQAQT